MAMTIYVLFGDDVRILYFQPSADNAFAFFTSLSFFLYLLEMILHSWAKSDFSQGLFRIKGYAFSFFFWLDLLAVLSMVPDVAWLASSLGMQSGLLDSFGRKYVVRVAYYSQDLPSNSIRRKSILHFYFQGQKQGRQERLARNQAVLSGWLVLCVL